MSDRVSSGVPLDRRALLEVRAKVMAEAARFRQRLPSLLPLHEDKWVVFRDGEVASIHASEEEAYVAGLDRFGPYGGQVVAQVRKAEPLVLSALAALGL